MSELNNNEGKGNGLGLGKEDLSKRFSVNLYISQMEVECSCSARMGNLRKREVLAWAKKHYKETGHTEIYVKVEGSISY